MDKRKYYKWMFIINALWAWFLSGSALLSGPTTDMNLSEVGVIYYNGFMLSVLLFGIGYFIVGINITQNHGIVILSVIAKTLVFISFTTYFFTGLVSQFQFIAGIIDMASAILFIEFLVKYPKIKP